MKTFLSWLAVAFLALAVVFWFFQKFPDTIIALGVSFLAALISLAFAEKKNSD